MNGCAGMTNSRPVGCLIYTGMRELREKSQVRPVTGIVIVAVLILFVAFPIMAWPHLLRNWDSSQTDQEAYLGLGLDIRNGVRLTDGNHHLLLPLILSLFSSYEWAYFTSAKLLNLAFALFSLTILLFLNKKLFGIEVALLSVALTALNSDLLGTVTRVISEPLFTMFLILAIYFWYEGLGKGQAKFHRSGPMGFAVAGAATGIAYLVKGTGQLLLVCFILWALGSGYWRKNWSSVVGFVVAYFVVVSPLLIYNMQNWGNPFYNFNSSHAMWYDGWDDYHLLPDSTSATLSSYLASHSIGDILSRFVSGGLMLIRKKGDVLFPLHSLVILSVSGAVSAAGLFKGKQSSRLPIEDSGRHNRLGVLLIPASILTLWFAFFSWYYPISSSDRHFIPLLPLVNTIISFVLFHSIATIGSKKVKRNFAGAFYISIIVFSLYGAVDSIITLRKYETWNAYASDVQNNAKLDELLQGLEASKEKPVTVINGPNQLIPSWLAGKNTLTIKEIPRQCDSVEDLLALMANTDVDYLIVDAQVITYRPFLQDYFHLEGERDFEIAWGIPTLSLMADYRLNRKRIMIFETIE